MAQSDIRKWFMKSHDKANASKPAPAALPKPSAEPQEQKVHGGQESSGRRKTSKHFPPSKPKQDEEEKVPVQVPAKRKAQSDTVGSSRPSPVKKVQKVSDDDDDDFVMPQSKKKEATPPSKKLKNASGLGIPQSLKDENESDDNEAKAAETPSKSGGRGRGGRGSSSAAPAGGRGRGAGRGGFMNFGERKDPPHKGEKEVPEGDPNCLAGLTFVISGTLDSLEREEAEDLIKRHGGRVTGSVSKKTSYLLCDEDIEGRKSSKAKELGTPFLTEDGLFDKIRASFRVKAPVQEAKKLVDSARETSLPNKSPKKVALKSSSDRIGSSLACRVSPKQLPSDASLARRKEQTTEHSDLTWTEKYRPKVPNDIIGNQSLVKQLHDWLAHWHEQFLHTGTKKKGNKPNNPGAKKAVLLSGTPGIGKTTSAKLVSQMLGFQVIEVNASDSRGKANSKIGKGIDGSTTNRVKELVTQKSLSMDKSKHSKSVLNCGKKSVLIMDEVDGMSAGDRGGVADLIDSIKISEIPIICICNDRYSQKLKSLVNYCMLLSFRKPTKQQMAKRLKQVANAEGLQVNNEIALEELADRVNGDMRMALNQLQYMSLSMSVINYEDVRQRLQSSKKDEDISPFTAVDKLFGFNAGKLRMDERVDLSMSDPDLVPLLIQENYINYKPSAAAKDASGVERMNLIAHAAESIGNGDIINVQIRKYRQWQLSQSGSLSSSIIPAALLRGQRETLEQGERNFNRFGGWLGKNSTLGKNTRLLEDLHFHLLASRESCSGRETLRVEYLPLLLKRLSVPLRKLSKDEAVQEVVEFMNTYSISQDDYDTIVELSKFQGHPNPLDGILPAVKAALTKAYKEGRNSRVRVAEFATFPGMKKAPKKRIAAILEPSDDVLVENNDDTLGLSEDENSSDTEDLEGSAGGEKLQQDLQSLNKKGMEVQLDLKGAANKTAKRTPAGRGKGGSSSATEKKGGRGSGSGSKRKR
ncbi:replication factor C subunit 1 isoform X2 [Argentina anserina]|uniref:replication factor C subunit 1 isoform X2 n=1 Tax=Argentina anserina TaxID=57926 RepID=UPI0021765C6C|nr:replication factor C subunit 1 isoform X2 [Potentilla anserina]